LSRRIKILAGSEEFWFVEKGNVQDITIRIECENVKPDPFSHSFIQESMRDNTSDDSGENFI